MADDLKLRPQPVEFLSGVIPVARPRRRWVPYVIAAVIGVAGFFVPLVLTNKHWLDVVGQGLVLGVAATGIGILVRQTGLVNFGAGAMFGGGAYLFMISSEQFGLEAIPAFLIGLVATAALAFVVGILTVRSGHLAFAILTIAFSSLLVQFIVTQFARPVTGAADGRILRTTGTFFGLDAKAMFAANTFWYVGWVAIILAVAVAVWVEYSRLGRVARAIQENEERMRFAGYRVLWPKVAVFVISGVLGGLAGMLSAMHYSFVSTSQIESGASILVAALLGGAHSPYGPLVGALVYALAKDAFGAADQIDLLTGIGIIVVIVLLRRGIVGLIEDIVRLVKRWAGRGKGL